MSSVLAWTAQERCWSAEVWGNLQSPAECQATCYWYRWMVCYPESHKAKTGTYAYVDWLLAFDSTPILIILSLLQTEIICNYVIESATSPIVCCCITLKNATTYTSSHKLLNKSAMHMVISLLLQSRNFWWYLCLLWCCFTTSYWHHTDIIQCLPVYSDC